jgi:cobalt-zinc-cadmium resistance protein CzcA
MLDRVIRWSLAHRWLVVGAWLALAILGVHAFTRLPLDAFPDVTPVQVQVNTVAPALGPLEVERLITTRVEQAISGVPNVLEVRSLSRFALSQVTVTFEDDTDVWHARQVLGERLATVELPAGIERPAMGPVATGLGEVFHYLVTGEGHSLAELRTIHDRLIRPQLVSVPGVAEVNAWGGEERQVHVVVDPRELATRGLTMAELVEALERNNANVSGGVAVAAGGSAFVQGIGIATSREDVASMVVAARDGVPIRVGDVARVVDGAEIRRSSVTAQGKGEAVLGLGFMLIGENSRDVTRRLEARLREVVPSLPEGVHVETVYERTQLVDRVLATVKKNLLEAAILVVALLFAFLGNVRAGLIVAAAIPLSLLFAFNLMTRVGIAGSLMSLGAIDFGLVVDSSVIMVENSMRRLGAEGRVRSRLEVVRDASIEVRRPTMFGELIILIVYLPILTLEGMEGKLFRPMALTVAFALFGSMVLSLTLVPVLCSWFLPERISDRSEWLPRRLATAYRPVIEWALRWRAAVVASALVALAAGALLATRLGSEFVPRLREGTIVINTVRLAGISLEESTRYGTRIEQLLLAQFPDEIDRIWTRTGTPEVATDPMGIEVSDVFISLKPREDWKRARTQDELVKLMDYEMQVLPGMRMIFMQPIEMRVNEMVAGIRTDVGVKLFGDDLDVLREKGEEIERVIRTLPGAADVSTEQITGQPVLEVQVDREAIARQGIPAREVLDVVEALGGRHVGDIQDGGYRVPLVLRLDPSYLSDPALLAEALVTSSNGDRVALADLATIRRVEGPTTVNREWGRRRVVVQANVRGRDIGSFVAEARSAIASRVQLPAGYFVRFGGQFEHLESARRRLMLVVPASLALILVLLYMTYGRMLDVARVFLGVPFAAVGGVAALWLRGIPFSVSAAVGFIALSGVSGLANMVLVSTIRQLLAEGMTLRQAIVEAAVRRLRPVLMTALVAGLGFLPMALNTGLGAEVQRPLATVVIGGVVSSTLLTLLVIPVLYTLGGARRAASAATGTTP